MILDQNRGPARSSGNIDRSRRHHHCPARLYAIYAREFQPVRNAFLGQAPRASTRRTRLFADVQPMAFTFLVCRLALGRRHILSLDRPDLRNLKWSNLATASPVSL